ncbi:MAG: aminoacyl-tRNA hydrolase [Candidatus Arsenophonus melophagi]|nr:aminoacyl-tRNA hydrolase [Candidatus Arsenophonus melophagi]
MVCNIHLIVGLGNPGSEYTLTRHNAGAWYVALLAKHYNLALKKESKFFGYTARIAFANHHVRLLIPTTYMNCSGKSVSALTHFYRIKPTEILVAHDELDLMPGKAKIKFGGSNCGHNGLKDIQNKLGNNPDFYRLRIGIGHPCNKKSVVQFVLSPPSIVEKKLIDKTLDKVISNTSLLINTGVHKTIN